MESPPSTSTWSEAFILSDDSGLLLTSGSVSSGSMSGESRSGYGQLPLEFQDSDCEEDKSLSQADSLDGMSDIICGENFNTLKKGPHWSELTENCVVKNSQSPIAPPPEFRDDEKPCFYQEFARNLAKIILKQAFIEVKRHNETFFKPCTPVLPIPHFNLKLQQPKSSKKNYWSPDFLPFSPCHGNSISNRPSSRSSLGSSRLSSSHNSLSRQRTDDSSFITQAVSHDTLSSNQISDLYNVPLDGDIYTVPVDTVKPPLPPRKVLNCNQQVTTTQTQSKRRRRNTSSGCREHEKRQVKQMVTKHRGFLKPERSSTESSVEKRHSLAGTSSADVNAEPIHMTLSEVRAYLQNLYSSSSDSSDHNNKKSSLLRSTSNSTSSKIRNNNNNNNSIFNNNNGFNLMKRNTIQMQMQIAANNHQNVLLKKNLNSSSCDGGGIKGGGGKNGKDNIVVVKRKKFFSLKQTLCNLFRFKRYSSSAASNSPEHVKTFDLMNNSGKNGSGELDVVFETEPHKMQQQQQQQISHRALPPLPEKVMFTTSIQRVKDCGWYWGPISAEAAERILRNEPDGSFIVRDSSDHHYIFSLTFKLNNFTRHVRIEHDQGNFSFGSCTKFKSETIVDFIENAVEHSRSGRYLFFLHHRRPVGEGPVRVQLLHPVSRFKQTQSLQHMCRFVILKMVRKDLIPSLPLPRRMIDYLSTPHYYSENLTDIEEVEEKDFVQNPNLNNQTQSLSDTPLDSGDEEVARIQQMNNYILVNNENNHES